MKIPKNSRLKHSEAPHVAHVAVLSRRGRAMVTMDERYTLRWCGDSLVEGNLTGTDLVENALRVRTVHNGGRQDQKSDLLVWHAHEPVSASSIWHLTWYFIIQRS